MRTFSFIAAAFLCTGCVSTVLPSAEAKRRDAELSIIRDNYGQIQERISRSGRGAAVVVFEGSSYSVIPADYPEQVANRVARGKTCYSVNEASALVEPAPFSCREAASRGSDRAVLMHRLARLKTQIARLEAHRRELDEATVVSSKLSLANYEALEVQGTKLTELKELSVKSQDDLKHAAERLQETIAHVNDELGKVEEVLRGIRK